MSDLTKDDRPQYRNIHISQILFYRLPPSGIVSILHRVSGAGLFLFLPFLLFLFRQSLVSEVGFVSMKEIAALWYVKIIVLGLSWAYLHHFCAGVRHLFLDVHVGLTLAQGRTSALTVLGVSLVLTLIVALKIFGAF